MKKCQVNRSLHIPQDRVRERKRQIMNDTNPSKVDRTNYLLENETTKNVKHKKTASTLYFSQLAIITQRE